MIPPVFLSNYIYFLWGCMVRVANRYMVKKTERSLVSFSWKIYLVHCLYFLQLFHPWCS